MVNKNLQTLKGLFVSNAKEKECALEMDKIRELLAKVDELEDVSAEESEVDIEGGEDSESTEDED